MLKCKECGNTEEFYVGAKEYHTWKIDNKKNFLEDIENSDSEMSDDYRCAECDSWEVEDKE